MCKVHIDVGDIKCLYQGCLPVRAKLSARGFSSRTGGQIMVQCITFAEMEDLVRYKVC